MILRGIDWQLIYIGQDNFTTLLTIPQRKWYPEVALARDAPIPGQVLDPGQITGFHVGRMPFDLVSSCQQFFLEIKKTDEPLLAHDVFNR